MVGVFFISRRVVPRDASLYLGDVFFIERDGYMKKVLLVLMMLGAFLLTSCQTATPVKELSTEEKNVLLENAGPILKDVLTTGELIVLTSPDYPPYAYIKVVNGTPQVVGFDVDVAQLIADRLGVKLVIKELQFNSIIVALNTGTGHLGISGFTPTEERKQAIDFSIEYLSGNQTYIANKNVADKIKTKEDLSNYKVGVQMGSLQEQIAIDLGLTNLLTLKDLNMLVNEVNTGKLDAMIVSENSAKNFLINNKDVVMGNFILDEEGSEGVAVAVPKGNEDMVAIVDEVLKELMDSGELYTMFDEATERSNDAAKESGQSVGFSFIWQYRTLFINGLITTLGISLITVVLGTVLGFLIALGRLSKYKAIKGIFTGYVSILRGTPLLVQVYIIVFGLPQFGISFPEVSWITNSSYLFGALFALVLNSSAYVSEIFRAGIQNVDSGIVEAGRSLGLTKRMTMKMIILPVAIKNVLPALGNEFVVMIKESSIVSVVGVTDLMYAADKAGSASYKRFEALIVAAIIYFIVTSVLAWMLKKYEEKVSLYDKH